MGERAIEPTASAEAKELKRARTGRTRLPEAAGAAVAAEHGERMAPVFEQLDGVREGARGQLDIVAVPLEQLDERTENEHVRRVREIDPDAHAAAMLVRRPVSPDFSRGSSSQERPGVIAGSFAYELVSNSPLVHARRRGARGVRGRCRARGNG